jgi:hypothetical protein
MLELPYYSAGHKLEAVRNLRAAGITARGKNIRREIEIYNLIRHNGPKLRP